jgi:HK97 family phage portal protein
MRFFRRDREERAALPPWTITTGPGGLNLPTWAGVTVSPDQAMRLSACWACVRLLADTVSTLPVDVFRRGEREALATTPLILVEPAAGSPIHEHLYSVMVSLLLRGNAYGVVTARQGATLLPTQVELVNPDAVSVQVLEDGRLLYRVNGKEIDREDVWHVKAFTMPGSVMGLSPVEYARQAIGLGLAAEEFGARFFGDGATPSGLLTTDLPIDENQAKLAQKRWEKFNGDRKRRTAFLGEKLRWQQISIRPDESQFVETMKFNVAQIARVFGVPASMIGGEEDNSLTYATVESRAMDFLRYSLNPWLVRIEHALGRLLPRNQFVKFNTGGMLRADTKTRYETYEIALRSGALTVDEVRELEDRPPLPRAGAPAGANGNGSGVPAETAVVA